jgi:hypothetical protein
MSTEETRTPDATPSTLVADLPAQPVEDDEAAHVKGGLLFVPNPKLVNPPDPGLPPDPDLPGIIERPRTG